MNLDEIASELEALGLNDDEATVYLRLLQTGPSKVSQLSAYFEMSRSTLYRVLDELAEKGFVAKSLDRPTVYTPEDPEAVFEIGSQELRRQLDHLESVRDRVLDPMEEIADLHGGGEEDPHHWKRLEGASRIYEVIHKRAQNADRSVEALSNHSLCTKSWLPIVEKAWRILAERARGDVDVRLLLGFEEPYERVPDGVDAGPLAVRRFDADDTVHFLLFDRSEIVLVLRPEDASLGQKDEVAVWTDAPGIVATHKALFTQRWPEATEVEEPGT